MNNKRNDSAHQRFIAPFQPLVYCSAAGAGTAARTFKVPIPDSRLRTKITVMFVPPAGSTPLSSLAAANATLWLYDAEFDESGVSGAAQPVTNIEGSSAAPTAIPAANGLYGYSRELVTAADAIWGAFLTGTNGTQAGTWQLQVTYTPVAVRFTPEEWDEITRSCNPICFGTTPRL